MYEFDEQLWERRTAIIGQDLLSFNSIALAAHRWLRMALSHYISLQLIRSSRRGHL